jgi:hypothetical protein
MKLKPVDREAFARLKAGALTAQGFLGDDERPPEEIIAEDEAAFARLGLDFSIVAEALAELAKRGGQGLGEPITVGSLLVQSGDARGMLPCPWGDGLFHKTAVSVQPAGRATAAGMAAEACADDENRIVYSDLSVHLLGVHHFCQGLGSPFRLEPELLARLLKG